MFLIILHCHLALYVYIIHMINITDMLELFSFSTCAVCKLHQITKAVNVSVAGGGY